MDVRHIRLVNVKIKAGKSDQFRRTMARTEYICDARFLCFGVDSNSGFDRLHHVNNICRPTKNLKFFLLKKNLPLNYDTFSASVHNSKTLDRPICYRKIPKWCLVTSMYDRNRYYFVFHTTEVACLSPGVVLKINCAEIMKVLTVYPIS